MEAAFREDAPGRDDDSSHTSYEDSSGPAVKGSMSGQGIDFDPEPEQRFKVPKSKHPKKLIRVHGGHLRWILRYLEDPVQMVNEFSYKRFLVLKLILTPLCVLLFLIIK